MVTRVRDPDAPRQPVPSACREAAAWAAVGSGWRPLFDRFDEAGFSFEWHDFKADAALDWGRSFHPGSIEICLNLDGHGTVQLAGAEACYEPGSAGFYCCGSGVLEARRWKDQRHRFVTVEFATAYLEEHLDGQGGALHPVVRRAVGRGGREAGLGPVRRLTGAQQHLASTLKAPPVAQAARALWYQCKAQELMAQFFFQADVPEQFCTRQNRLAEERVQRVIELLRADLAEPPGLQEIGRQIGCSPFYLSRTFSRQTGETIPQCLRRLRLERAAELLRDGRHNVTEAAMAVGYSSLSHFSLAFHQTYGCCPGLYPLKPSLVPGKTG